MTIAVTSDLIQDILAKGVEIEEAALIALVKGVIASDRGQERRDWIDLLSPDIQQDPALSEKLFKLQDEISNQVRPTDLTYSERLDAVRTQLKALNSAAFLVPRADRYQGEYVSAREDRLKWLTGFTGSAGLCIVTETQAALFVDGRYTIQVRTQVDNAQYSFHHLIEEPASGWLRDILPAGSSVAYDPWLHTPGQIDKLRAVLDSKNITLTPIETNLIDLVWTDQPEEALSPARIQPLDYAGETSEAKRNRLAASLTEAKIDAAVISAPDAVAWMLNIRGGDVPCTPMALGQALLRSDGTITLFMDQRKILPETRQHLGNAVELRPFADMADVLDQLTDMVVRLDDATGSDWVRNRLTAAGAKVKTGIDPCALPRACKNEVELNGSRAAHIRDGLAICRFLCWFDQQIAANQQLDEFDIEEKLLSFRKEDSLFRGVSFETIASSGPNAAINHYRCTEETNRILKAGELLLLDSGGQYLDGTTDITRTMPIGEVNPEYKRRFTLVLKGHIALGQAKFPAGTTGSQLDVLARLPLWQAGLDYDHGTGHGVGSYLGVHEGPQRISKMPNSIALKPGMILSNEPGFYKAGEYGIRIENLIAVVPLDKEHEESRDMLGFENLTLAPIDRRMVIGELMTTEEIAWLDAYHLRVWNTHEAHLSGDEREWLARMTAPLAEG